MNLQLLLIPYVGTWHFPDNIDFSQKSVKFRFVETHFFRQKSASEKPIESTWKLQFPNWNINS